MWHETISVASVGEAVAILAERGERARIVAGATDLILEIERGVRGGIETLVDVTRVAGLDQTALDEQGVIHLGPLVTHNACAASRLLVERAFPLAQAAWQVGAPQIRNRGTIAGNLITASPANDTIPPLIALGASVSLLSSRGQRSVPLSQFYTGVRTTVMRPDEMLVDIAFPAMRPQQRGAFIKLGLRAAQAISLVNAAVVLTFSGEPMGGLPGGVVSEAVITLGSVAPTILRAGQAEALLAGRPLDESGIEEAARLAVNAARPIDDVRSPADYRAEGVRVCVLRALRSILAETEKDGYPSQPVLLWGKDGHPTPRLGESFRHAGNAPIITRLNGQQVTLPGAQHKTLLRLLREDAGLIGTKEGCAEGECGACTVFLDGKAVMSCLVPAARAHGADIVTIEGLAKNGQLHPVQQAFIDEGAVQCGYCTPGFIMSAAMLLEERPGPTLEEIQAAITGNLCRCTGYYSIVRAIERAAREEVKRE
ncbi:MAG: FAD binding domain-containing protein [Anaerolineales bacterium]|nr:FAD binding domain-containing protein [Anaerolineales bacterium]